MITFNKVLKTANFLIKINDEFCHGRFWNAQEGDHWSGHLYFNENKELVDYEGFYEFPQEIADSLRENGYALDAFLVL